MSRKVNEYKAQREAAFDARNNELSAIAQFSKAHEGAFLVYWKKHFPLCYRLTGKYAIVDGVINLECQRNSQGAKFFKATQGSKYFYGSLVMGETITVYREGTPIVSDPEYIAKIRAIVNTQNGIKGVTVLSTPMPKPAPVVNISKPKTETPKSITPKHKYAAWLNASRKKLMETHGVNVNGTMMVSLSDPAVAAWSKVASSKRVTANAIAAMISSNPELNPVK